MVPSSRLLDPETVGYMLRSNLAGHPLSDFQHWSPWPPLVVATATELARFTGQHLITPQTILARDYLEQIFAGLRDAELAVFHVLLDADQKYCASASVPPTKHGPGAWRIWPTTRRRVRG